MKKLWWTSSSGRIEIQMTKQQANSASHSGECLFDVNALLPQLEKQLSTVKPELLASELKEYGAWSPEELKDHRENLRRLVWIAAGDISDGHCN